MLGFFFFFFFVEYINNLNNNDWAGVEFRIVKHGWTVSQNVTQYATKSRSDHPHGDRNIRCIMLSGQIFGD